MECTNCRHEREHGQTYEFHYGTTIRTTGSFDLSKLATIKQTHYLIAGQDSVWICDRCSTRFFSVILAAYLAFSLIFLALIFGLASQAPGGITPNFLLGSSVCCGLPWLLAGGIILTQKERMRTAFGEQYAIRARKKTLKRQGYNAFFTTSEYRRLERHK